MSTKVGSGRLRRHDSRWQRRGTHIADMGVHGAKVAGTFARNVASFGAHTLKDTLCRFSCCGYRAEFGQMDVDTHISYRPYFFNPFNLLDIAMIGVFIALIIVHIVAGVRADDIDWTQIEGFINVYNLAWLVRAKIYLLAITVFIVWIKTLEHLRVNRSLSTFILIIKGMLGKLTSFFIILAFSLIAFAGLQYIAYGLQEDDGSTLLLSLVDGFHGALGDVDMLQQYRFSRYISPFFQLSFAVFVLILLFNLLIAVMSEGYEEIKDQANATWCFTQFQMIDEQKKAKEYAAFMRETLRREMTEGNKKRMDKMKQFFCSVFCCACCCRGGTCCGPSPSVSPGSGAAPPPHAGAPKLGQSRRGLPQNGVKAQP